MEFTLKTIINAPAKTIYETWLSSEGHSKMTGGDAEISNEPGSPFTAWDGYIEGVNLELEPYSRILQSWRTTSFKQEEEDSQIEIILQDHEGQTELTLIHTNVPKDGESYKSGWQEHYFEPMQSYFSQL